MAVLATGATVADAVRASSAPASAASSQYQAPSRAAPVLAAFYFGNASPINFWSSDLSGAPAAFRQIQQDGFNAVELAVPWGEFQQGISPPTYNAAAFKSLDTLISLAASLHLQVVLRLSYEVDIDPSDQMPDRFMSVFSNQAVYNAWLAYISRVHQNVARFANVKIGELSWEDYWTPVAAAQSATTPAQELQLATTTGYRSWLRRTYSLAKVSSLYGTKFTNWSSVPTPSPTQPNFSLMYKYDDWAVVHKFFTPAAARFPRLNLEARVDADPLYDGTKVVSSYSHAATFKLPGTSYIGMYFSPYMGDPSPTPVETAQEALTALQSTLSSMHTRAGNRPLFIFEYEIVSNSPAVANDPGLPPSQVPAFILGSGTSLHAYTLGYALWTYRDYIQSPIYNPSFTLGTTGWTVGGSASPVTSATGSSLSLNAGASVSQAFPIGDLAATSAGQVTMSLNASAPTSTPTTVTVSLAGAPTQTITVRGGPQTYQVKVPASDIVNGSPTGHLSIAATSPVTISNVLVYQFTQLGDVYSTDGTPEVGAAPLRTLNQQLTSGGSTAGS